MRHDAQLDLRVIGGDDHVSRRRHESLADAAALRRADRDVLQVRVLRGQAARSRRPPGGSRCARARCAGCICAGSLSVYVDLSFDEPAVLHDEAGQLELERKLFQHVLGRRRLAGRGLALHRQRELAEQHILELLGRIEVEARPGGGVRCLLAGRADSSRSRRSAGAACPRRSARRGAPCSSSTGTSGCSMSSYTDSRRGSRSISGQSRCVQPEGDVRALGRVLRRAFDRHLVERQLLRRPCRRCPRADGLDPEVPRRDRIEVVPCGGAVEHVGFEHRVVAHAGKLDAVVAQDMRVELEMVSCLGARWILEQRPQAASTRPRSSCAGAPG